MNKGLLAQLLDGAGFRTTLLILLLSGSSAFANLGETKHQAIKAYGQPIRSDKGLTAYHKRWLVHCGGVRS